MRIRISRTCTRLTSDSSNEVESQSLSAVRDIPAYVLLGDPGLGKTTAFKMERDELGDESYFVRARDFLTFSPEDSPEWKDKILFIDGLDEVRAGQSDARTPLDQIRQHLVKLGRPRFRISCRMVDWLGDNDRTKLSAVSPNGEVVALALDPLAEADIKSILANRSPDTDVKSFMANAYDNGVQGFLVNPLSLEMLIALVSDGGGWPASRKELFERFSSLAARECNREHEIGAHKISISKLLAAAGRLCAVQLLTGKYGYSIDWRQADEDYLEATRCGFDEDALLQRALSTRLFRTVSEGKFSPVHRQTAEFLGARHLGELIDEGLPAGRVISLMAGDDGIVVTELRGLAAWLAAISKSARHALIEADPIGIGLYGDISDFSMDDRLSLLESMKGKMRRVEDFWDMGPAFKSIASPDMIPVLSRCLGESPQDVKQESFAQFLLSTLTCGTPLRELSEVLLGVVYDVDWSATTRQLALDAFIHNCEDETLRVKSLRQLLVDIRDGNVPDPDNELLGTLLDQLYPSELSPNEIWDFLLLKGSDSPNYRYRRFWRSRLLDRVTDEQAADLIDCFASRSKVLTPALQRLYLEELPFELLHRSLKARGDGIEAKTLYDWLSIGVPLWRQLRKDTFVQSIRTWLEERPNVQKSIILEAFERLSDSDIDNPWNGEHDALMRMYGAAPTPSFGQWFLEQSIARAKSEPVVAEYLLEMAIRAYRSQDNNNGLPVAQLREMVNSVEELSLKLEQLLIPRPVKLEETEQDREFNKYVEERRQKEAEYLVYLRSNETAFRENRATPSLLYQMAQEYFEQTVESTGKFGAEAIENLFNGDQRMIDAVIQGLRGIIDRYDLPDAAEIIRLNQEDRIHYLCLPLLAGVLEIWRTTPGKLHELHERQMRILVASYYCVVSTSDTPAWYSELASREPDVVASVQVQFTESEFRRGREYVSGLWSLSSDEALSEVAGLASLPLLRKFPTRCKRNQLGALSLLFIAAFKNADRESLRRLIYRKTSLRSMNVAQRAYWLAAGLIIEPKTFRVRAEEFATNSEQRSCHFASFFNKQMVGYLNESASGTLIRLVGKWYGPELSYSSGLRTPPIAASELVRKLINNVASLPTREASEVMNEILADDSLSAWRSYLLWAREGQLVIRRDTLFHHCSPEEVVDTLNGANPANPGDLAALLKDNFVELGRRIRTGNTDDWRQYWNLGAYGKPTKSKPENDCRDAVLSDLRHMLPEGVDAQPEGEYANDKRADIRASYAGFNVPVEVKKNEHRDLWTAMHRQLIKLYTADPSTGGFGIYLVFWFGSQCTQPPPEGDRPTSIGELQERLQATLTTEQARKISVCVIDVSKPGDQDSGKPAFVFSTSREAGEE